VRIVFYISGHGFGHASRQVEVINALHERRPDLDVIIRSAVDPALLERTLRGPYQLRPGACDSGVVQTDSVSHDDEATIRAAIGFYRTLSSRADEEARALADSDVRLVVGDIPPLAFEVAARLSVPSVAIANFTWDWIYDAMPGLTGRAPDLVPMIRQAYARATLALELPMAGGLDVFPTRRPIPFIARHATRARSETRTRFGLPIDRPVALLSFGGYGLPALDLRAIDCLDRWTIVTTDRTSAGSAGGPAAVVRIPESEFLKTGFRYEDLVAAADVVVTKPGYGIIAECAASGTAILYTSRGAFREYDVLVREMPRYVRSRFIAQPDLFAGRWSEALDAVIQQAAPPPAETNGAPVAAEALLASTIDNR
jgi:L-arabinokinase